MTHKITIIGTEHEFNANPDETVLDAALRAGLTIPYGCRGGMCGACMGDVKSGAIGYPTDSLPPALDQAQADEGKALFCQARADSDLCISVREVFGGEQIQPRILPSRIEKLERLNHDVMGVWLRLPSTQRLQFKAGQYVDFMVKGPEGEIERRSFSLANAPHDDELLEFHIRLVPGGYFTEKLFNEVKEKSLLRFEAPLGTFFLREDSDAPMVMVAGGTGFAPIKGLIEHCLGTGVTRPIHLYWGVRSKADLYSELPAQWAAEHPQITFIPVLSEPKDADDWQGRTGWVHDAVVTDFADLSAHQAYLCGPPPMIQAAQTAFSQAGLADDQLFFDSFDFQHQLIS